MRSRATEMGPIVNASLLQAVEREKRSVTNRFEALVIDFCRMIGIKNEAEKPAGRDKG